MAGFSTPPRLLAEVRRGPAVNMCDIAFSEEGTIRLIGTTVSLENAIRSVILTTCGNISLECDSQQLHKAVNEVISPAPSQWSLSRFASSSSSSSCSLTCEGCRNHGDHDDRHLAPYSREFNIKAILKCMILHGWSLVQASSASKRVGDQDILFLELYSNTTTKDRPEQIPQQIVLSMFSITFSDAYRIRLIDGPPALKTVVESAINFKRPAGIQKLTEHYGVVENHLNKLGISGHALRLSGVDAVVLNMLMLDILARIREQLG
ncbi:hypothetical protein BG004_008127, partial [Podila humilis]